jgi:hypothetical protein
MQPHVLEEAAAQVGGQMNGVLNQFCVAYREATPKKGVSVKPERGEGG